MGRHWCYTNKVSYDTIRRDVFTSERGQSLCLQWFKHHRQTSMYNHLVQIIAHSQQQHQAPHKRHGLPRAAGQRERGRERSRERERVELRRQNESNSLRTPSPQHCHEVRYEYSPGLLVKPEESERDLDNREYYYDHCQVDTEQIARNGDTSYRFELSLKSRGRVKSKSKRRVHLKFSVLDLITALQSLNLSTMNAVWQKIPKNEDDLIGDQQNLCLCLHILICIAVQNKYKSIYKEADYNLFQSEPVYLKFLDDVTSALCEYFANRAVRTKSTPNCLPLRDNVSASRIVIGFGDLVEEMPKWLHKSNDIILARR